MLGTNAVPKKMARKSKRPKARNPFALHASQRKGGVHKDKRRSEKTKQKEKIIEALSEEDVV